MLSSADSYVGPAYSTGDQESRDLRAKLNRLERQVIVALADESLSCRYHGRDFGFLGWQNEMPRCDSCKRPYMLTQLLLAAGGVIPSVSE
jgi:hypothetical protein